MCSKRFSHVRSRTNSGQTSREKHLCVVMLLLLVCHSEAIKVLADSSAATNVETALINDSLDHYLHTSGT